MTEPLGKRHESKNDEPKAPRLLKTIIAAGITAAANSIRKLTGSRASDALTKPEQTAEEIKAGNETVLNYLNHIRPTMGKVSIVLKAPATIANKTGVRQISADSILIYRDAAVTLADGTTTTLGMVTMKYVSNHIVEGAGAER